MRELLLLYCMMRLLLPYDYAIALNNGGTIPSQDGSTSFNKRKFVKALGFDLSNKEGATHALRTIMSYNASLVKRVTSYIAI